MYKDSLFSIILAVSFVCGSCMSENDKGLSYLFKEIGLKTVTVENIT